MALNSSDKSSGICDSNLMPSAFCWGLNLRGCGLGVETRSSEARCGQATRVSFRLQLAGLQPRQPANIFTCVEERFMRSTVHRADIET